MAWIWVIVIAILVLAFLLHSWPFKGHNLPPGPKGFPIFGSLHLIGKLPHRDLHSLSRKYGPIMHMRLGLVHTIIVSSPRAAELFLKTHDQMFASRPLIQTSKIISYGQKDLVFVPYGSYWRKIRKMCTLELFSPLKINLFKSTRAEVRELIEYLKTASKDGVAVGLSSKVSSLIADMTCLMVFGKKYRDEEFGERGFKAVIQESMQLAIAPNLADYIPFFASFNIHIAS
ncbi:cytochrome P450 71AU50-like [Benincasa hispida]|uniref:cytochrome P450 71AU50-like n=1 Tax=Benincasa hispida TaxID=102211 RepID=UPI0019000BA4|nr:cytochrome P450 71AU50-like [Benincasa hispida]